MLGVNLIYVSKGDPSDAFMCLWSWSAMNQAVTGCLTVFAHADVDLIIHY